MMTRRAFVRILKRAQRDLAALPLDDRKLIGAQIQALGADPSPRGADAMFGQPSVTMRVRVYSRRFS